MSNPYLDGMIKAAAVFPSFDTLARLSKTSPMLADKALYHLDRLHEHSSAIEHLTAQHEAHAQAVTNAAASISKNGTSGAGVRDLETAMSKKKRVEERLAAHSQGMREHESQFKNAVTLNSRYGKAKNVGPSPTGVRPDHVESAWNESKSERLF